ncbi:MAG TPA: hypothetical protein VEB63_07925 [Chitinophagaceae bacterium]|nr:hypothetical protein [Chitinophagaceae bacterium]
MEKVSTSKDMRTLASCLNKLVLDGFKENFKASEMGLLSLDGEKLYTPAEVEIVNFYRFEGESDPADSSILYAIRTKDGIKGTLTDAYGPYADPNVSKFIKEVESITKKPVNPKPMNHDTSAN